MNRGQEMSEQSAFTSRVCYSSYAQQVPPDEFHKCSDLQVVREIRTMVDALEGISSILKSDHFNNLLQDVDGSLPHDKQSMLAVPDEFLQLPAQEQTLYQAGR